MKKNSGPIYVVVALIVVGCKREVSGTGAAIGPASTNELVNSFRSASQDAKGAIAEVAAAVAEKDDARAFASLYALQGRNDLSDAQRKEIAKSMFEANARLQAAAAGGNKDAQKLLEDYRGAR